MSYLPCLCFFVHNGVQHILCCFFLRIVYPMLPVSLGCTFLIAHSIFSNVYLRLCFRIWKVCFFVTGWGWNGRWFSPSTPVSSTQPPPPIYYHVSYISKSLLSLFASIHFHFLISIMDITSANPWLTCYFYRSDSVYDVRFILNNMLLNQRLKCVNQR